GVAVERADACVHGRAAALEVVIVGRGVDEQLAGGGDDRVLVLPGGRLPLGQGALAVAVGDVQAEVVHHHVVVADQVGGRLPQPDAAAVVAGGVAVEDVVKERVGGVAPGGHLHGKVLVVGRQHDRVVLEQVVGARGGVGRLIQVVQRDPVLDVVVDQVVAEDAVGRGRGVDAAEVVVVDDVVLHQPGGGEGVDGAGGPVDVQPVPVVVGQRVGADGKVLVPRHVDPVLVGGVLAHVALQQQAVAVAGEDADEP